MTLRSCATAKPAQRAATTVKVCIVYVYVWRSEMRCENWVMHSMKAAMKMRLEGCLRRVGLDD